MTATCKDIYEIAFSTHTGCYLSPAIGAPSICQLPCGDLWKIFRLVAGALLSGPLETSRQMFQVSSCSRMLSRSTSKQHVFEVDTEVSGRVNNALTCFV